MKYNKGHTYSFYPAISPCIDHIKLAKWSIGLHCQWQYKANSTSYARNKHRILCCNMTCNTTLNDTVMLKRHKIIQWISHLFTSFDFIKLQDRGKPYFLPFSASPEESLDLMTLIIYFLYIYIYKVSEQQTLALGVLLPRRD